jgi:DNA-binding MarR family transcriptional regulator
VSPSKKSAPDDAVPWLTAEELDDWKALVALIMTLPPALDAQLKRDAGLNLFEYHVLARLSEVESRSLPMTDLAVLSQGSPSRLSHAVGRLEQAGWVVRKNCSEGGRRIEAYLTDAGLAKIKEAAPGHVREARRLVLDQLTPQQLRGLGGAARPIVTAIDPTLGRRLELG